MILLLPLLRIIFFLPIYLVWIITSTLVRCFIYCTSPHQMPAHTARRLVRQNKIAEAGRWYVQMLMADQYSNLVGKSIWGPRSGEAVRFLKTHGDQLPGELRMLMTDILWSYAFLDEEPSLMSEMANDSQALMDLAAKLVVFAHAPKDSAKINRINDSAKACETTAAKLAAALRHEPVLRLKFPMRPMQSPIRTERSAAKAVRNTTGNCNFCGDTGDCRGLDLYSAVCFFFEEPTPGTIGATSYYSFIRFLGWWELLFCSNCLPASAVRTAHKHLVRVAITSGSIFALCCLLLVVMLMAGYSGVWAPVIIVAVGFVSLCTSVAKLPKALSYSSFELKYFSQRLREFISENRRDLISACDITKNALHWRGVHEPSDDNIAFYIEPSEPSSEFADESGTCWINKGIATLG